MVNKLMFSRIRTALFCSLSETVCRGCRHAFLFMSEITFSPFTAFLEECLYFSTKSTFDMSVATNTADGVRGTLGFRPL